MSKTDTIEDTFRTVAADYFREDGGRSFNALLDMVKDGLGRKSAVPDAFKVTYKVFYEYLDAITVYSESAETSTNLLVDSAKEAIFEQYRRMFPEPHIDKDAYFNKDAYFDKDVYFEVFMKSMFNNHFYLRKDHADPKDTSRFPLLEAWWEKLSSREKFEQVASTWGWIVTSLVNEVRR